MKLSQALLLSTTTLQLLNAPISFADPSENQASNQFPYLNHGACPDQVLRPTNGANAYLYYSRDCKTAFVLPRHKGIMEVSKPEFGPAVTVASCESTETISSQASALRALIYDNEKTRVEIAKLLNNPDLTDEKSKDLQARLNLVADSTADLRQSLADLYSEIDSIEGYHFTIGLNTDVASDLHAYVAANPKRDDKPAIQFEAAPIQNGVISFFPSADNSKLRAIQTTKIPGLSASAQDQYDVQSSHINSNEGLSGKVVLTLAGSCSIIKTSATKVLRDGTTRHVYDPRQAENYRSHGSIMVANFTYDVPVQVSWGVEASVHITPENLHSSVTKQAHVTPEMNRSEFVTRVLEGSLEQSFKFVWKAPAGVGTQLPPEPTDKTKTGSLKWDFMYTFKDQIYEMVLAKMETHGYLVRKASSELPIGQVNPAKTARTVIERRCERIRSGIKAGWGLWDGGEHCQDVARIQYDLTTGIAVSNDDFKDKMDIKVSEHLQIDEAINVLHSSTFRIGEQATSPRMN